MSIWKKFFKEKEEKQKKQEAKQKVKQDESKEKKIREETKSKSDIKQTEIYSTEKGIILGPVISEKTRRLAQKGEYVFYVDPRANKVEIRQEIEKMFQVKVSTVRTINLQKRVRGVTRIPSVRPKRKKAIIKLAKGTISVFE